MEAKVITKYLRYVLTRLKESKLPFQAVSLRKTLMLGYYNEKRKLIGSDGPEFYGDNARLSSIAAIESHRRKSIGRKIVNDINLRGKVPIG